MSEDQPYSKKVEEVYNAVDEVFVDKLNEYNLSFTEIGIVLMLLNDKFDQEKVKAFLTYYSSETEKKDDGQIYK